MDREKCRQIRTAVDAALTEIGSKLGVVFAGAWYSYRAAQPGRLVLRFHPFVGEEALVLDAVRYANPGGEGRFKVRDFQFFISNITLTCCSLNREATIWRLVSAGSWRIIPFKCRFNCHP